MDFMRLVLFLVCFFTAPLTAKKDACAPILSRIYHGNIDEVTKTALEGEWTSDRCEVRPGPEYLMRKYTIYHGNIFTATQYYYGDVFCTHPLFSISAQGFLKISKKQMILIPGAYKGVYHLTKVSVTPFTDEVAKKLFEIADRKCDEKRWQYSEWQRGKTIDIQSHLKYHNEILDFDCTHSFDFSLNELQLIRVEEEVRKHRVYRRLMLGEIHTNRNQRTIHRPSAFQVELVPSDTHKCGICKMIAKSTTLNPPSLHYHIIDTEPKIPLKGEWFSERCESMSFSHFLTRRMILKDHQNWESYYHYYSDILCRDALYTITTSGTWKDNGPHKHMTGTRNLVFHAKQATLKVEDKRICNNLNSVASPPCGIRGSWFVGKEQKLTESNGCPALGIVLPYTVHEIARINHNNRQVQLLFGARRTDLVTEKEADYLPTSFQSPLAFCGHYIPRMVDSPNSALKKYKWKGFGVGSTLKISFWILTISILISLVNL